MALISNLIATLTADIVCIMDENFNQVFVPARPLKATIKDTSKFMEHPTERGAMFTDFKIDDPIEVEFSIIIRGDDMKDTFQQLKQAKKQATSLIVQTKTDSYSNMVIYEMPHDEDADMFDAVAVAVKLREVIIVNAQYGKLPASKVKNKTKASTVNRGEVQATKSTATATTSGSVAFKAYEAGKAAFKNTFGF